MVEEFPEIVLGLIAPIGTNLDLLQQELKEALATVGYDSEYIRLIESVPEFQTLDAKSTFELMQKKIQLGTRLREKSGRSDFFAGVAVNEIQKRRFAKNDRLSDDKQRLITPVSKTAYILRQLKTKEEVASLRRIYGQGLYLISAYSSYKNRKIALSRRLGGGISSSESDRNAKALIESDEEEKGKGKFGQQLRDTFPKADYFIDMDKGEREVHSAVSRFIDLIFKVLRTPTKMEVGMFHAYGAALTSSALARQVGASICNANGEVLAVGANEVPNPKGGVYWDEDSDKQREYELGYDINQSSKKVIFMEIARAMKEKGLLKEDPKESWWNDIDRKALLLDSTEVSRTVHAEMAALMTAARLGLQVKDCTLFTTTFPCHNCAKHIIAAGVKEIVYVEPYPKSLTTKLYPDSMQMDEGKTEKIPLHPFVGVSPRRYVDLFAMDHETFEVARKDEEGNAMKPEHKAWKWTPRFGLESLAGLKENLLITSFGHITDGSGKAAYG